MLSVSIVVPCFRGEETLEPLVKEISHLISRQQTAQGIPWRVSEVVLVWDGGTSELATQIQNLAHSLPFVKAIWLSQNSGQHAATCAGLRNATGDWVITLDEDGQHDPSEIGLLLDAAYGEQSLLVYARGNQSRHNGVMRSTSSKVAKAVISGIGLSHAKSFQSFRLIWGEIARSVGSLTAAGVYLDVALSWYTRNPVTVNTNLRQGLGRPSGYSVRKLFAHFWLLFISVGPRSMRLLGAVGIASAIAGVSFGIFFLVQAASGVQLPPGWASQITATLFFSGFILISLGLISEYLASVFGKILGRPAFFEINNPFLE